MRCPKCGFENSDKSQFCGQCGGAIPLSTYVIEHLPGYIGEKILASKPRLEGERKVISVLFTDVANYSSFSEKLDLEAVQEIMNNYFKLLMEIVYKYEGIVAQLLGDGMLVFFGAPLAHEDHAQRACYSALAMQAATREYSKQMQKQYDIDFKLRVGINSGPVFVSTIGNDLHMEYLAIGDTVNLASRIQNAASPGHILASVNTHHLAKHYFDFETIKGVSIKGKEQPIEVNKVLEARKVENRFDVAVIEGLSRFCGREVELGSLAKTLCEVEKGYGRVIGIIGEPGIGKSRLIREFRESLTPDEGAFLEGRCRHVGNSVPYMPLMDILRSFFNIKEEDTETHVKEKIIAKARQLDEQLVNDLPFLYEIFSLNIEDKIHFNIQSEHRRNKMFITTYKFLAKESSQKPLVIIIEDLHWIDEISEDLLAYLIQKLENNPVLFLLSYRPEYSPSWKNYPGYRQIHLNQLSAPSSSELLQSLLPVGELSTDLTTLILAKAGGNPLFVEEYTYALLEEGTIRNEDGHYFLNALPDSIKLPDTLQGIIASRIDRLPQDLKNTLQVAAVIGRDFGYDVLRAVLHTPQKLRTQLEKLEDLEFIIQGSLVSETEYTFKHALIQEVAYGGLSNKRQQELHENVARIVENIYSDRLEEFMDVLAYHFRNGQSLDKALDYGITAGDKAKATFANQAAIEYYKKALELCAKFPGIGDGIGAKMLENLANIYVLTAQFDQALDSYENSFRLSEKYYEFINSPSKKLATPPELLAKHLPLPASREERLATLYFGRSQICLWRRQIDDGLKWADQGLVLTEISDRIRARLLYNKAFLHLQGGEYASALNFCQKALEFAHKIQDETEAMAYCTMGYIHNLSGQTKIQADYYQRALDIAIRLQKPELEAEALDSMANYFGLSDDWDRAQMYYKKSLSISEKIGSSYMHSRSLTNYSDLLIRRGHIAELEEAIDYNLKGLDIWSEGWREVKNVCYANLAWAYSKLGNVEKAREYSDKMLKALEQGFSKYWFCQGYLARAEVFFESGETEAALDYCQKSIDMAIEIKSLNFQGQNLLLMGRIYHRLGQWDRAEEMLKKSLKHLENTPSPPDQKALALWYLANVYQDMNAANFRNIPRATIYELAQKAEEIFIRLGIYYDIELANKLKVA